MEKYQLQKRIGRGSFGEVFVALDRKSRNNCVIKVVGIAKLSPKEREHAHKEVELLSQLRHDHIVGYVDSFQDVRAG